MENKTHIARVISGKKAGIVYSQHMGSNSLKNIAENSEKINLNKNELLSEKTYVILLRDPYEKWLHSMYQDIEQVLEFFLGVDLLHFKKESFYKVCDLLFSEPWPAFFRKHGELNSWIYHHYPERSIPFDEFKNELRYIHDTIGLPNVYYMHLKDLSNPAFLEWLHKKDEDWKSVEEIPHLTESTKKKKWWVEDLTKYLSNRKDIFNIHRVSTWDNFVSSNLALLYIKQDTKLVDYLLKSKQSLRF